MEEEIKILDYLQNRLSDTDREEVEQLLATSAAFAEKFKEVSGAWQDLGTRELPEMSPASKNNFQAMLKIFELEQEHGKKSGSSVMLQKIRGLFLYRPKYNWAYSVLLVAIGAAGAYLFFKPQYKPENQVAAIAEDQVQTKMLVMLEDPVAVKRMKAVGFTQEMRSVNDKVINALLATLNTDGDENVRLVTLAALVKLADNPKVREGLVNSILLQKSPLMQVAMADAMLKLQEKRSVKNIRRLLENQSDENELIKEKLNQTVKMLETI
jgi:hypothetical protein